MWFPLLAPKHSEHPIGDHEATDDVNGSSSDGNGPKHGADNTLTASSRNERSYQGDTGDRIGGGHKRGMQQGRHLADDLKPQKPCQDEDVE